VCGYTGGLGRAPLQWRFLGESHVRPLAGAGGDGSSDIMFLLGDITVGPLVWSRALVFVGFCHCPTNSPLFVVLRELPVHVEALCCASACAYRPSSQWLVLHLGRLDGCFVAVVELLWQMLCCYHISLGGYSLSDGCFATNVASVSAGALLSRSCPCGGCFTTMVVWGSPPVDAFPLIFVDVYVYLL
jgi:hypothetical protein